MIYPQLPTEEHHAHTDAPSLWWCRSSGRSLCGCRLPFLPFPRSAKYLEVDHKVTELRTTFICSIYRERSRELLQKARPQALLLVKMCIVSGKRANENYITLVYLWAKALCRCFFFLLFHPMACCVSMFSLPDWWNICFRSVVILYQTKKSRYALTIM